MEVCAVVVVPSSFEDAIRLLRGKGRGISNLSAKPSHLRTPSPRRTTLRLFRPPKTVLRHDAVGFLAGDTTVPRPPGLLLAWSSPCDKLSAMSRASTLLPPCFLLGSSRDTHYSSLAGATATPAPARSCGRHGANNNTVTVTFTGIVTVTVTVTLKTPSVTLLASLSDTKPDAPPPQQGCH